MSRKAQFTFDFLAFAPRFIFLIFVVAALVTLVNSNVSNYTDARALEGNLFIDTLLTSPDGFAAQDAQGKVLLGTLDLDKFNTQHLENSFGTAKHLAAQFTLYPVNAPHLSTITDYNKESFTLYEALAKRKLVGSGKAILVERTSRVLVDGKPYELHSKVVIV